MIPIKAPAAAIDHGYATGDPWFGVPVERLREALTELRAQGFESWCFMTAVDHLASPLVTPPPARFELVYELRDMGGHRLVRVRCFVDGDPPHAPSVADLFEPANWDERECYDLLGIVFDGHPNLVRILLPEDWVGHPLRRDYPVGGEPVDFSEDHEAWQTAPRDA